jgi:DNA-3-methyladenine glycosylase II
VNIENAEEIDAARRALAALDPALAVAHAATPIWAWRLRPGGFAGLVKMVVEQQVSVAAANAIWGRFEAGLGDVTPHAVLARDIDNLKLYGLSAPKARYAHAIARAHIEGHVDFNRLSELDDEAATAALVSIKGVGRWTAETYLMFTEGRFDMFPAGDVALQEALRVADGAPTRLQEKALYARAESWRPYRGVAAHLLWAYYGGVKRGEIAPPPAASSQNAVS